jgi:hypothetical protein
MTDLTASNLAFILDSIRNDDIQRNWQQVWQNEEEFALMQDTLDDLIQFSAMVLPGSDLQQTQLFIGKITMAKVQLQAMWEAQDDEQAFITCAQALENDIKEMLIDSPLVQNIYTILKNSSASLESMLEDGADATVANAILFVVSALPIISSNQQMCDDQECEEIHS